MTMSKTFIPVECDPVRLPIRGLSTRFSHKIIFHLKTQTRVFFKCGHVDNKFFNKIKKIIYLFA